METLQSTIFIEFDVNTKKITFLRGDGIIDYDSNVTSVYVRVKYKNLSGNTVYLTPSELEGYKFSLFTIKPATNNVNVITGEVTDELKENVYGGVVKFEIPGACTNRLGIVKCEIHINQGNKIIGSSTFVLDVKQSLVTAFDDELLGDEDFPVLKQLILEIQKDSNIDDNNTSLITTYSSDKIETIKEGLNSKIEEKAIKGNCELHVGVNQEFTNIQSAINNVTSEKNIIIVHEGQYKEKILLDEINVTIKGVDKDLVTIWNDKGKYGEEPVLIRGGNVKISNVSILSKYEDIGDSNGCYALHIDRSESSNSVYSQSEIIIENCNITSYNHAGVGCGTENDQTIRLINCNISSYKNVGLLYHTSIVNMRNQKFSLVNCNLFSDTYFPLLIKNDTPNSSGFEVEFINNNLVGNNSYTQGTGQEKNILNALTKNSYGNNDTKLNYNPPKQMYQLTSDNGDGVQVTDFNNVRTGFFKGDGSSGCLNTPTAERYIGYSVSYGETYIVQFAFAILNNFKMYMRFKTTSWGSWTEFNPSSQGVVAKNDGTCMEVTDLNNATLCGFYTADPTKSGLNCPTNDSVYIAQTISYSTSGFLVQYAWSITGSNMYKKYKRGKDANVWSSWVEVSE